MERLRRICRRRCRTSTNGLVECGGNDSGWNRSFLGCNSMQYGLTDLFVKDAIVGLERLLRRLGDLFAKNVETTVGLEREFLTEAFLSFSGEFVMPSILGLLE